MPLQQLQNLLKSWERPSWDTYFMATAMLMAARSPCERLHVGCVLVSQEPHPNRIIAAGYNGFLPSTPHVSRVVDDHEQGTVHAEQNAVTDAARRGVSLNNATAYITHYPCIHCFKILVSAGIRHIHYYEDYKNNALITELARESQVTLKQLVETRKFS